MNGVENPPRPGQADTKFWFEIAVVLIFLALGGWLYMSGSFDRQVVERPGSCLILPERYCNTGTPITYLGQEALGFNLPEGTPIYAPYDGVFFEDEILYEDEEDTIIADRFIRAKFGIPGTSIFVFFVSEHSPSLRDGDVIREGELAAVTVDSTSPLDEETDSNFILYTQDYNLSTLFSQNH